MLVLITGGSGSGKSEYAEERVMGLGENRVYIATMYSFDEESKLKIKRHRAMRKEKKFRTIECFIGIHNLNLDKEDTVLLECMSNLVANEMYQEGGAKENTPEFIIQGIKELNGKVKNLVIVSNEVFSDGIIYDEETTTYLSYLGEINRRIGLMADEVIEVVYSIPIHHKG
jgi:adenosylcobinamide kinase/adenosylcobinamide-phosphate guanylyltransferase